MTTRIRDEALARGHLGQAALDMMRAVFREQVPRFRGTVDGQDVDDLVNSFFEDKGAGYANMIVASPDDGAARRETRKWVERWLVDRARERPRGALRHRLEKRLQRSDLFAPSSVRHYWYLAGGEDVDRLVGDDEQRAIAAGTPIDVTFGGAAPARLGRTGQLEEMLRRILAAAGRLHIVDLTRICEDRFPTLLETGDVLDSTKEADWDVIVDTVAAPNDGSTITEEKRRDERAAAQLLPELTARERTVIRFITEPTTLARELGVGRSSAYSAIAQLRARLTEMAGDADRGGEVLSALIELVLDDTAAVPSPDSMTMEDSRG